LAAFDSFDEVREMIKLFKKRRDVMFSELSKIRCIEVYKSPGAFYMFPNMKEVVKKVGSSKELAIKLIEEAGVITIPGEVFPLNVGKNFLRFSFAIDEDKIKEGVKRIKDVIEKIVDEKS
jgi:aspartate aminotransferase